MRVRVLPILLLAGVAAGTRAQAPAQAQAQPQAPAKAQPQPQAQTPVAGNAEAAAWEAQIRRSYSHYKRVDVIFSARASDAAEPPCRGAGGKALARLRFEPWRLRARLAPRDAHVFAPVTISVRRLADGVSGYDVYRRAASRPAPHFCFVDKATHLLLQWGRWWVELRVPCRAGQMAPYEVVDLLDMLAARDPDLALPDEAVFSFCGQMQVSFVTLEALRERGTRPRRFWGKPFPDVRAAARAEAGR